MKKEFSKAWKASKQPRKQRKYRANAPLHIKRKYLSVNLSKDLRKKLGKRSIITKKEDVVKIMRGKHKGKTGKILDIFTKIGKVHVEGIQVKKQEGSKVSIKLQPSNLQIIEMTDRGKKIKETKTKEVKNEDKEVKTAKTKTSENKPLENEPLKKVPKTEKKK